MDKEKTPLKGESTKDDFIYTRIENELLSKIDTLKTKKGFKNRSQTIRRILNWAFENGVDAA
jgi:hypothetical protein